MGHAILALPLSAYGFGSTMAGRYGLAQGRKAAALHEGRAVQDADTADDGATFGDQTPRRNPLRPLRAITPYVTRYRTQLLLAATALLTATFATLMLPIAIRRMIDYGFGDGDPSLIDGYFYSLLAVVAVLAVASASRYYFVTWLGERVVSDLRRDVFFHLTRLSPGFFDTARSGEVLSRLTADTTQIKAAVGSSMSIALRNMLLGIGAVAMMIVTSPRLSTFVLVAIPLIVLPLIWFGRAVRRRSRHAQDTLADATAFAGEQIGAVRTLQAFTAEPVVRSRFAEAVDTAFRAARASTAARSVLTAIALFLVFSSVVVVLWVGARDVFAGTMSAGTLSQFLLYSVFAAGALGEVSQVWAEVQQASGAAERLIEILEEEPAVVVPAKPARFPDAARGSVTLRDVVFHYPARPDEPVLQGLDLDISPGEKVALVGPSGAGKSTIFQMLQRFYDPQSGEILIDEVNIREADPLDVRGLMALVPQDTVIFADTVAENIRYGIPEADRAAIERAAKLARADGFIGQMAQGYDTEIGERGVTLSGGQRQRIAIARAILRDAPILLLDEATSSLDAESEQLVTQALTELMEGRTTLVIAHRLATILHCDRIVVIDQGRIVEQGTHDELTGAGGLYARLARLQFSAGLSGQEAGISDAAE
jgi:ATP-binding cassette subfamily B protein